MLVQTERLLACLKAVPTPSRAIEAAVLRDIVLRFGSGADAQALLPWCLETADAFALPVLARFGTPETGWSLFAAMVDSHGLRPDCPAEVLQVVGTTGYAPAVPALWAIAREAPHHESRAACLGLMDLPCEPISAAISETIRGLGARSLFPEFLPSLAFHAADPGLLPLLPRLAAQTAVDNIAGIILGLAAFGDPAIPHLLPFLNDRRWDAHSTATGTAPHLRMAVLGAGMSVIDLYDAWRADALAGIGGDAMRYRLSCLLALLPGPQVSDDLPIGWPRLLQRSGDAHAAIYDRMFGTPCDGGPDLDDLVARWDAASDGAETMPDVDAAEAALAALIGRDQMLSVLRSQPGRVG
ncbi:hypothetical protein [Phreatobacter cathodiphilus]|uniref:Uncharacterized protein n=1 Tax=Phreatobacter cathodiphilus TaxID=1868589 RepID=A0A2S0NBF5_9HYPH|nr:hypothetical protein [Phreatobacter cathodiphilus]AVO45488.1 hypothetical protein C6569_10660 [Phreatobacter cathodiphilus]